LLKIFLIIIFVLLLIGWYFTKEEKKAKVIRPITRDIVKEYLNSMYPKSEWASYYCSEPMEFSAELINNTKSKIKRVAIDEKNIRISGFSIEGLIYCEMYRALLEKYKDTNYYWEGKQYINEQDMHVIEEIVLDYSKSSEIYKAESKLIQNMQENMAKGKETKLREEKAKERAKFNELVKRFISLYRHKNGEIPFSCADIPIEDYEAFLKILEQEGIHINKTEVLEKVFDIQNEMFREKLTEVSNINLNGNSDIYEWIDAYLLAFNNNLNYIDILETYLIYIDYDFDQIDSVEEYAKEIIQNKRIKKRARQIEKALNSGERINRITIEDVDIMDGREFEIFIAELYKHMGYSVKVTPATSDQGADLIIERFDEKTAIQAKRYNGNVGNSAVQEVVAAKSYYNCDKAMIVTNSFFTNSAEQLARCNNVELIDRNRLEQLILDNLS